MIALHKYFHWFYYAKRQHFAFNFGMGGFLVLFLWVAQPFGIYDNNVSELVLLGLLIPLGLIWIAISYGTDFVIRRVLKLPAAKDHKLDFRSWVLKLILLIHITFVLRGIFCSWQCVDIWEYLQSWLAFGLLFAICYLPFAFYAKYSFFHQMVGNEKEEEAGMLLKGQTKDSVRIDPARLVYAKSDDNYVELWMQEESSGLRKVLLRATLKSIQEQVSGFSQFVRIHRSYLINTRYFAAYHKGKNTLTLSIGKSEINLPVSQSYKPMVETLFIHPK